MTAALTYRDFRIVWLGALVSTIGTWMQKVAQSWLVLTLAGASSAFYLGLDSFLGEAPILLLTLVGGVVADRMDRRHVLIASQVVQMSTALTLAALVYTDQVRIWHVLTLSVITGIAQAFGGPAHHSLMPSLVPKEHLPNAIAFNAIQFNVARVIGPLISGRRAGRLRHGGVLRPQRPLVRGGDHRHAAAERAAAGRERRQEHEGRDARRLRLHAHRPVARRAWPRSGSWARSWPARC